MIMLLKTGNPVSLDSSLSNLSADLNIAVTFDDAFQSVYENALPILRNKIIPAAVFVPSGYLGKKPGWIKDPHHPYAGEIVMTREQLQNLPADLITVGSHTVSHINPHKVDKNTLRREALESKATLENILNRSVDLFAAPFATLDEKHADVFIQAGYKRVFLNIPTYPASRTDLYLMGRTSVEPTDWPIEFKLKLSGAYQWLPIAIHIKRLFFNT